MSVTYAVTFLDELKAGLYDRTFTEQEWPKLQQAAEVHGYRGPSKKKHNGIVLVTRVY
jgi:hypothetical protein